MTGAVVRGVLLWLGCAACAGPTPVGEHARRAQAPALASSAGRAAAAAAAAADPEATRVLVTIDFEPPLRAHGELHIAHESGWQHRCAAPPAGVSVRMPEGPASMRLHVAGQWFELTMHAKEDGAAHVWRF